jgi:hypothetical protein
MVFVEGTRTTLMVIDTIVFVYALLRVESQQTVDPVTHSLQRFDTD